MVNAQHRNVGPQMSSRLRISAPSATKAHGFCDVVFLAQPTKKDMSPFLRRKEMDVFSLCYPTEICGEATTLARTPSVTAGTVKQEKGRSVRLALSRIYAQPISSAPCATRVSFATCFKRKCLFGYSSSKTRRFFSDFGNFNTSEAMVHLLYIFLILGNDKELTCEPYTCDVGSNESCAVCREYLVVSC